MHATRKLDLTTTEITKAQVFHSMTNLEHLLGLKDCYRSNVRNEDTVEVSKFVVQTLRVISVILHLPRRFLTCVLVRSVMLTNKAYS